MRQVWRPAFLVAVVGVVLPLVGGFLVGKLIAPQAHWISHFFLGATLCATSVGISARIFQELKIAHTPNAKVVLGAAVIDDVLGLLVLSVLTGIVVSLNAGQSFQVDGAAYSLAIAVLFLVLAVGLGSFVSRKIFVFASRFRVSHVLLPLSLAFCFLLAALASLAGLAPLVGAYAAGLVLDDFHVRIFKEKGEHDLADLVSPVSQFFAPLFFVLTGAKVDISILAQSRVLMFGALLAVLAVVSKVAAGFVLPKTQFNRLLVGFGMVPRGEVGLIFASLGATLSVAGVPLVSQEIFSALVVMVLASTVLGPCLLKYQLGRMSRVG